MIQLACYISLKNKTKTKIKVKSIMRHGIFFNFLKILLYNFNKVGRSWYFAVLSGNRKVFIFPTIFAQNVSLPTKGVHKSVFFFNTKSNCFLNITLSSSWMNKNRKQPNRSESYFFGVWVIPETTILDLVVIKMLKPFLIFF